MKTLVTWAALAVCAAPLWAAPQTITLSVPGMNCPTCPITIKKALSKVSGVIQTDILLDKREVKVRYEDSQTDAQALMRATREAGYPSTVSPAKP